MRLLTVLRKAKRFRLVFGQNPDEFKMPGVDLDVEAYWQWVASENAKSKGEKD